MVITALPLATIYLHCRWDAMELKMSQKAVGWALAQPTKDLW